MSTPDGLSSREPLITPDVRAYFLAMLIFVIVLDFVIEPMLKLYTYSNLWYVTGITINGKPLLLLIEYPLAVALWIGAARLVQRSLRWGWRRAFYGTFLAFAILEELFNNFVVRLWTYSGCVLWTGNFWLDLPPRLVFGWMLWALLVDVIVVLSTRLRTTVSTRR